MALSGAGIWPAVGEDWAGGGGRDGFHGSVQGALRLFPALPPVATRWRTPLGSEARTPSLGGKPPSQADRLGDSAL